MGMGDRCTGRGVGGRCEGRGGGRDRRGRGRGCGCGRGVLGGGAGRRAGGWGGARGGARGGAPRALPEARGRCGVSTRAVRAPPSARGPEAGDGAECAVSDRGPGARGAGLGGVGGGVQDGGLRTRRGPRAPAREGHRRPRRRGEDTVRVSAGTPAARPPRQRLTPRVPCERRRPRDERVAHALARGRPGWTCGPVAGPGRPGRCSGAEGPARTWGAARAAGREESRRDLRGGWGHGYPLYQLGNPQLRVFRTNFFIRLVRPGTAQPEDTVQFRIPMEMTRVDVRNYLERIYNVPVAAVRTRVQHGSNRKRDYRNVRMKKPDYKVAYVQLAHGQTFTFPDLFPEKKQSPDGSPSDEDIQDRLLDEQRRRQSRDPRRGGVPGWFGL
uniref:Large ribosomal subunit protein uL23m n=3 Tax=Felinae TaxID=338152 RepID=A0ABI7W6K6_FELCA